MAHTRAADDFQAIRARMEELRREHERAPGTETESGSVSPRRRENGDPVAIGLGPHQRYRSISIEPRSNSEPCLPQGKLEWKR
jgi:hypothetical protein